MLACTHRRRAALCTAIAAAALAGCRTARPPALHLDVLAERPAADPIDLTPLLAAAAQPRESTYLEDRGLLLIQTEAAGGDLIERRSLLTGDGRKPLIESRRRIRGDGAMVLVEEINHEEEVEVVFNPPLLVLPPALAPGEPAEQVLEMIVHPLGDRSRIRARGRVEQTVTYDGSQRIAIPAGQFDAAKITAVFEAALSIARVTNTTEDWLNLTDPEAPGLLAERRQETTRVLLPSTKRRLLVLLETSEEE